MCHLLHISRRAFGAALFSFALSCAQAALAQPSDKGSLFAYRDAVRAPSMPGCREHDMRILERDLNKSVPWGDGRFWRISRNGKTSYLLGTMHVADPRIKALPAELERVLPELRQVYIEVLLNAESTQTFAITMLQEPDVPTLKELLSAELYQRTAQILQRYYMPEQAVNRLEPWAAFVTMLYPPDTALKEPMDAYVARRATEAGIPVKGLETIQEQLDLLDTLALEEQLWLLRDTVCYYEVMMQDMEVMKQLYLEDDMVTLYNFGTILPDVGKALYERLLHRMVTERNLRMFERMQPAMAAGGALVAVGAMHLPGENGLLALLAADGYTLKLLNASSQ